MIENDRDELEEALITSDIGIIRKYIHEIKQKETKLNPTK